MISQVFFAIFDKKILHKIASQKYHICTHASPKSAIMEADGATSIIIIGGMTMDYTAGRGTTALGSTTQNRLETMLLAVFNFLFHPLFHPFHFSFLHLAG